MVLHIECRKAELKIDWKRSRFPSSFEKYVTTIMILLCVKPGCEYSDFPLMTNKLYMILSRMYVAPSFDCGNLTHNIALSSRMK
jgi:hypothetical protein